MVRLAGQLPTPMEARKPVIRWAGNAQRREAHSTWAAACATAPAAVPNLVDPSATQPMCKVEEVLVQPQGCPPYPPKRDLTSLLRPSLLECHQQARTVDYILISDTFDDECGIVVS